MNGHHPPLKIGDVLSGLGDVVDDLFNVLLPTRIVVEIPGGEVLSEHARSGELLTHPVVQVVPESLLLPLERFHHPTLENDPVGHLGATAPNSCHATSFVDAHGIQHKIPGRAVFQSDDVFVLAKFKPGLHQIDQEVAADSLHQRGHRRTDHLCRRRLTEESRHGGVRFTHLSVTDDVLDLLLNGARSIERGRQIDAPDGLIDGVDEVAVAFFAFP